jgi:hypothetical protein
MVARIRINNPSTRSCPRDLRPFGTLLVSKALSRRMGSRRLRAGVRAASTEARARPQSWLQATRQSVFPHVSQATHDSPNCPTECTVCSPAESATARTHYRGTKQPSHQRPESLPQWLPPSRRIQRPSQWHPDRDARDFAALALSTPRTFARRAFKTGRARSNGLPGKPSIDICVLPRP